MTSSLMKKLESRRLLSPELEARGLTALIFLVFLLVALPACQGSCVWGNHSSGSTTNSPGYTYHLVGTLTGVSGFPGITVTVTPIIPPKALNANLSNYVQVDVQVGAFHFSTNDPVYQCLQGVIPLLFVDEIDFPGLFIAAYQNCGGIVKLGGQANQASLADLAENPNNDLYAMFTFPRSTPLCAASSSGQTRCMQLRPETPTPVVVPPTVQILSPSAGAPYTIRESNNVTLVLSSQTSAGVVSYVWSDTLGLVHDSNANDTLTLTYTTTADLLVCNELLSDTISLTVTGNHGRTCSFDKGKVCIGLGSALRALKEQ